MSWKSKYLKMKGCAPKCNKKSHNNMKIQPNHFVQFKTLVKIQSNHIYHFVQLKT